LEQLFDIFNRPEKPQIILTKPSGEQVFEIGDYTNLITNMKYNDVSEISFDIYEKDVEEYELIKGKKYVNILTYGIFIISSAVETDDGLSKYKTVTCKSVDYELTYKRITLEPKVYKLYDIFSPKETLIGRLLEKIPSWSIGTVDASIGGQYRYFDIEDTTLLSFIFGNLEDSFQCVVEVDYENRKLSFKDLGSIGKNTNIYLSFDNIVDSIKIDELSDEVVTNLNVYGGNNLNIRSVNPTGTNDIVNLNYFKNLEWMSQSLISALGVYETKYNSKTTLYSNYLLSYKNINEQISILKSQLGVLENELGALVTLRRERIQAGISITSLYSQISSKENDVRLKNSEITNKTQQLNNYITLINGIVESLSITANFTEAQILELDKVSISYTYQNDAYTITDTMSEVEKIEQAELLLKDAKEILTRLSNPRFSFKVELADFLKMHDFSDFIKEFNLASIIYIELRDGNVVETRLISYSHDWDSNKLDLEFTSKYRTNDPTYEYEELYSKSVSAGISVSFSKYNYSEWSRDSKDVVSTFISSALDASLNNVISSENQDMLMDSNGLRGRQSSGSGYLDEQIWVTNNMIAFTDNSWNTAKMAIGKIDFDGVSVFGVVGEVIVGNIIAGNQLRISNQNNNFVLDNSGATLTNASFTMTTNNNKGRIILDPTVGIKIQNNSTGTFTDGIALGSDGRIKAKYLDISGDSTFGGTLNGANGTFKGNLNAVGGTFSGNLNAAGGTFSGNLSAAGGTFSGTLSSGISINSPIINGGEFITGYTGSDKGIISVKDNKIEFLRGGDLSLQYASISADYGDLELYASKEVKIRAYGDEDVTITGANINLNGLNKVEISDDLEVNGTSDLFRVEAYSIKCSNFMTIGGHTVLTTNSNYISRINVGSRMIGGGSSGSVTVDVDSDKVMTQNQGSGVYSSYLQCFTNKLEVVVNGTPHTILSW